MQLGVAAVAAAFALGAFVGRSIARFAFSGWEALAGISVALAAFLALALGLPFAPFYLSEVLLTAAGAAVIAWPMSALRRMPKGADFKTAPRHLLLLFASGLPLGAMTMTTLNERWNYAERLRWTCDGPIAERTRAKRNHNLPTLVVSSPDGPRRFEMVAAPLWDQAEPGQRLVKAPGSAFALLEGKKVRMVPEGFHWWNDPDAPVRR